MGKGAYVSINNLSNTELYIEYDGFKSMYTDGKEGSDFSSISGEIKADQILPSNDEKKQYIEADASGFNMFEPSEFTMTIKTAKDGEKLASIKFHERWCTWSFENLENYYTADAVVGLTIKEEGSQYRINVNISKNKISIVNSDTYTHENALTFAKLSSAAYQAEDELTKNLSAWEFTEKKIFTYNLPDIGELAGAGNAFVAGNDKDIVLCFRGTDDLQDMLIDICGIPVKKDGLGKVHLGFITALDSFWDEIVEYIEKISDKGQNLWITGHSLGASLAALATGKFIKAKKDKNIKGIYTYGQTTVGDEEFVGIINGSQLKDKFYRFVNYRDIVPTLAPEFMGYKYICDFFYFDKKNKLSIKKAYEHNTTNLIIYFIEILADTVFDHLDIFVDFIQEVWGLPDNELEIVEALIKDHIMSFKYDEKTELSKTLGGHKTNGEDVQNSMKNFLAELEYAGVDIKDVILDYHGIDKYIAHVAENKDFKN